jgi:hypothetical protein
LAPTEVLPGVGQMRFEGSLRRHQWGCRRGKRWRCRGSRSGRSRAAATGCAVRDRRAWIGKPPTRGLRPTGLVRRGPVAEKILRLPGTLCGLHREAFSRGAATATPSQEAAAVASLMAGIMLHRPRESGRRLALRMAAGRSSFAMAEALEQHGLFCELDTDRGSHCLHTQGRGGGIGDLVFLAFFVRRARHLLSAFGRLCGGGIPRGSESIPATPPPSWPPYRSPILEGRSILAPCHGGAPRMAPMMMTISARAGPAGCM